MCFHPVVSLVQFFLDDTTEFCDIIKIVDALPELFLVFLSLVLRQIAKVFGERLSERLEFLFGLVGISHISIGGEFWKFGSGM